MTSAPRNPRLVLIKDGGKRLSVYEGRKLLERFEVDGVPIDAAIVEEARTWRQPAALPKDVA